MKQTLKKIINRFKAVSGNQRNNPEITIIGFPKCGTTALPKKTLEIWLMEEYCRATHSHAHI